ncbi:MAG: hypothetical protein O9322_01630 [Beijerinckiaceae bacterium]|nr:hypothetical protein [Beijerinckiaceae bacterium]MCZ8301964.1 hypothetical protein [Beijerinckiaceae bacterium]
MSMRMRSFPRFFAIAGLLVALGGLPGCVGVDPGLVQGGIKGYFSQTPEERKVAMAEIAKADNWSSITFWNTTMGDAMFYLPDSFRTDLTRNEDTFINYAIGAYLAQYPEVTYDSVNSWLDEIGILEKAGITRERIEYARGFGRVWLKSLEDDPKNRAMKERLELFKKRFGQGSSAYKRVFPPHRMRALLRDDAAFKAFLTDDAYAETWVEQNRDVNATTRDRTFQYRSIQEFLSPVTIGILPGLAS